MIEAARQAGMAVGWVGGDGLYGHGMQLGNAIRNRGLTFMLATHRAQPLFTNKLAFAVPERTAAREPAPSNAPPDRPLMTVSAHARALSASAWQTVSVRDSTKSTLTSAVHAAHRWVRDSNRDTVREPVLVLGRHVADDQTAYSLFNVNSPNLWRE